MGKEKVYRFPLPRLLACALMSSRMALRRCNERRGVSWRKRVPCAEKARRLSALTHTFLWLSEGFRAAEDSVVGCASSEAMPGMRMFQLRSAGGRK